MTQNNSSERVMMNNGYKKRHTYDRPGRWTAILLILILAVSLTGVTGCGVKKNGEAGGEHQSTDTAQDSGKATENTQGKEDADSGATRSFTDDCGREVEIPEKVTQVVASGNVAQIFLYAVAPDTLMAIPGKYSKEAKQYVPKEYRNLAEIGSFFGSHDLNYEEIAKLGPQIVIDVGEKKPSMKADLEDITTKTGIPAVHIDAYYDTMDEAFRKLGVLLGREVEGNELADYCTRALEQSMSAAEAAKKDGKQVSLLYCTQEDGLNVLAKGSYHAEVIDKMADNLAVLTDPSSQGTGNEVNLEQMLLWDPEVIIFAPQSYYDYVKDDPAWQVLKAVKDDRYYEVPFGPYNWAGSPPSSNRVLGMLWMAALLYPDYVKYDIEQETIKYYQLFYHHDLTDKEYKKLVKNSIIKKD